MSTFAELSDVDVTYVCDVDQRVLDQRAEQLTKATSRQPKKVADYRTILDDKNVDALVIGTPDHWHALPTIHACQAGKDVYVVCSKLFSTKCKLFGFAKQMNGGALTAGDDFDFDQFIGKKFLLTVGPKPKGEGNPIVAVTPMPT